MKTIHYDLLTGMTLVIFIILSIPFHTGPLVYDEGDYLKCAVALLSGEIPFEENFYAHRIGTYLPLALGITVFGFGKYLSFIILGQFVLGLGIMYGILRNYYQSVAFLFVVGMCSSAPIFIASGTVLGDSATMFFVNAPFLIFWIIITQRIQERKRLIGLGILAGILFFWSLLIKESAAFIIPVIILVAYVFRGQGLKPFWKAFTITFAIGVTLLFIWYGFMTGNPFYRIMAVASGPSASDCNYAGAAWIGILKRITYQPFQFFARDFTSGIIFFFAMYFTVFGPRFTLHRKLLLPWFLGTLGMWWFGTQSVHGYNPTALVYRIWFPVLLPMTLVAAWGVVLFFQKISRRPMVPIGILFGYILIATAALFAAQNMHRDANVYNEFLTILKYGLFGLIILVVCSLKVLYDWRIILVLIIITSWFNAWINLYSFYIAGNRYGTYDAEKVFLQNIPDGIKVITDNGLYRNHGIYNGFQKWSVTFFDMHDYECIPQGYYLLINKNRMEMDGVPETQVFTTGLKSNYEQLLDDTSLIIVNETEMHILYTVRE